MPRRPVGGLAVPASTIGIALAVAAVLLVATRGDGANVSNDSVQYMTGARAIAEHHAFLGIDGLPLSLFPPGLSTVWAALPSSGPLMALILNLVVFAATIVTTGTWLSRRVRAPVAVAAAGMLALSPAMLFVHRSAWSEPLFVLLTLVWFLLLTRNVPHLRTPASAVGLGLLAGAAGLVRYAALGLVPVALVVFALSRPGWRRWAVQSAAFCLPFGLVLGAWLARNLAVTGTIAGPRAPNAESPLRLLQDALGTVGDLVAPSASFGLALTAAAVGVVGVLSFPRWDCADRRVAVALVAVVYVVVGFVVLLVMASRTNVDALDRRLLAPLVAPAVIMGAVLGDVALDRLGWRSATALSLTALVVLGAWPVYLAIGMVTRGVAPGYNGPLWRSPALATLLRSVPAGTTWTSNQPKPVAYLTRHEVAESPRTVIYHSVEPADDLGGYVADARRHQTVLVWLPRPRDYHLPPEVLAAAMPMRRIAVTPAGSVWLIG